MPEQGETLLGFDFGVRRIGVAIGNTLTCSARPLSQIDARVSERSFEAIERLLREWQPHKLVVGRPLHPDGARHAMTDRCERFARQLNGRFRLPVELVDERYSSVDAAAAGASDALDAESAAIILRQYLDSN